MTDDPFDPAAGPDRTPDGEAPIPGLDALPPLPDGAVIDAQIARALDELPAAVPVVAPVTSLAEHRERRSRRARWSVPVAGVAASVLAVVGFGVLTGNGNDDDQIASIEAADFADDRASDSADEATDTDIRITAGNAESSMMAESAPAEAAEAAPEAAPADTAGAADAPAADADDAAADIGSPPSTATPVRMLLPDSCAELADEIETSGAITGVVPGDGESVVDVTVETPDGIRRLTIDTALCGTGGVDPILADVPVG